MTTTTIPRTMGGTLFLNLSAAQSVLLTYVTQVTFRDGISGAMFRDGETRATFRDGVSGVTFRDGESQVTFRDGVVQTGGR